MGINDWETNLYFVGSDGSVELWSARTTLLLSLVFVLVYIIRLVMPQSDFGITKS